MTAPSPSRRRGRGGAGRRLATEETSTRWASSPCPPPPPLRAIPLSRACGAGGETLIGRRLTPGERTLARSVFAATLDLDRVRLVATPLRTAVTTGGVIWMPADAPRDFSIVPAPLQAWLVHELVHAWQFAVTPAWTLRSWARVVVSGGYGPGLPGYAYAHPFDWDSLNLEQQARVVEHAFLTREGAAVEAATPCEDRPRRRATREDFASRTPFEALTRPGTAQAVAA